MAYNWHDDGYGFHGNTTQPSSRLRLRNYDGPYDPAALMRARDELMYHVQCTQNTAAWSRIRMKTPVNVNCIRDDDDGFGEPSDMYSHAELPENEEFEEHCQGHQVNYDNLIPLTSMVNTQQKPTATVTREEDMEEIKEVDHDCIDIDNDSDDDEDDGDGHESGEKIEIKKEMDTITIETSDSDNDSDCNIVEQNKDLIISEQIEAGGENTCTRLAETMDELEHQEIDKGDAEKDSKFESSNDEGHETDKKRVSKDTETIAIETCITENEDSEEQNIESHNEDEVVTITIETDTNDNTISNIEVLGKNEARVVKQETLTRPVPCSESILKCDHCEVRCSDGKSMRKHLNSAVHYSASKYNVDDVGELILMKKVVTTNMEARYKTIIMKCPVASCPFIFPQMDLCVQHFNERHWKRWMPKSQYGLTKVVKEEECSITLKPPTCGQCAESFPSESYLGRHMKDAGHFPFTLIKNCKKTFFCKYCEKSCNSFDGLVCHHRVHRKVAGDVFNFKVFQYESVRTFIITEGGRRSKKRKRNRMYPDNEGNIKVIRTMDGKGVSVKGCNEAVADKADSEHDVGTIVRDKESVDNTEIYDAMRNAMNRAKSVLSAVRSDSDSLAEKDGEKDDLQNVFKCDFCSEISNSEEQMISHLNEMCHRSASSVLIDDDKNVQYIKCLSSVFGAIGKPQKVYAACPENCQLLFDTVTEGIVHYILCHNYNIELKPCYGVVEVADEVTFKVSPNKCFICGETFKRLKQLSMHFKAKHYPFSLKQGCETFFRCVYCPRFFYRFNAAVMHVMLHKKLAKNGMRDLTVLYCDCDVKRIELPPKHSCNVDKWKGEIRKTQYTIRNLEATLQKIVQKDAKKKMKNDIRSLKGSLIKKFC